MRHEIRNFFDRHVALFLAGRIDEMAERYLHPLGIFHNGTITPRRSKHDTIDALFAQHAIALTLGVRTISWSGAEETADPSGRVPVLVEWLLRDSKGRPVGRLQTRYFIGRTDTGSPIIEIIDIVEDVRRLTVPRGTPPRHH